MHDNFFSSVFIVTNGEFENFASIWNCTRSSSTKALRSIWHNLSFISKFDHLIRPSVQSTYSFWVCCSAMKWTVFHLDGMARVLFQWQQFISDILYRIYYIHSWMKILWKKWWQLWQYNTYILYPWLNENCVRKTWWEKRRASVKAGHQA